MDPIVLASPEMTAILLVFGAVVGSFIGLVTLRLPEQRTVLTGRSQCDHCHAVLRPSELIPMLSYLAQRGRCRRCGGPIAIEQPLAELGGSIVGLLAACTTSDPVGAVLWAIFGWMLLALILLDVRAMWLPHILTIPLIAAGLASAQLLPKITLGDRLLGALFGYASLAILRRVYRQVRHREGLGGGDAYLFSGIGAWLGLSALPWVLLLASGTALLVVLGRRLNGNRVASTDRIPLGAYLGFIALLLMPFVARFGVAVAPL